jgi:hypothetical protein
MGYRLNHTNQPTWYGIHLSGACRGDGATQLTLGKFSPRQLRGDTRRRLEGKVLKRPYVHPLGSSEAGRSREKM